MEPRKPFRMIYPKHLRRDEYFSTPIWMTDAPQLVKSLNKASDPYIKESKKALKKGIATRNKTYGNKGDMGNVFHSKSLIEDNKFKDLSLYILQTSENLLKEMGFSLDNHKLFITELWVQEFAKQGAGWHSTHTHWNGHISGFMFLKASDRTSLPTFHDPRTGNLMNLLPLKTTNVVKPGVHSVTYKPTPGRMIFFPSYLAHEYIPDMGYDPFRFIHWNVQAIPKGVLYKVKEFNK